MDAGLGMTGGAGANDGVAVVVMLGMTLGAPLGTALEVPLGV